MEVDDEEYRLDEKYFTSNCYSGFNDDDTGFYTVYREFFDRIIDQEQPHRYARKSTGEDYPRFGCGHTEWSEVKYFYDRWQSFVTAIRFAHLDPHDVRQAPNRRVLRLMEKENNKVRDEARKKRNTQIQAN